VVLVPSPVEAHLVTTGLGPYYDGIGHLLVTPQDLLPLMALALLGGLAGPDRARQLLFAVPVAWFAGGLAGLTQSQEILAPILTALTILVVGGLVAADRKLPSAATLAVGTLIALVHGFLNGTAMSSAGLGLAALAGIAGTAFVLMALGGAWAVAWRSGWTRIALRVAGSWIVATGMLMLGWAFR
jgi:hydrogenase/urease accessory protein HupE